MRYLTLTWQNPPMNNTACLLNAKNFYLFVFKILLCDIGFDFLPISIFSYSAVSYLTSIGYPKNNLSTAGKPLLAGIVKV